MITLSHRGLDLDQAGAPGESTIAAFEIALQRGFGLEVDLQMLSDGAFLIWHDYDLGRWSQGQRREHWRDLDSKEVRELETQHGRLCWWNDLIKLHSQYPHLWIAVHLKAKNQTEQILGRWREELKKLPSRRRFLVFDLLPSVAKDYRRSFSDLGLAVSVADPFDVNRFSSVTGGTLIPFAEAVSSLQGTCDWLWLDEWDRKAQGGGQKDLYSRETIQNAHDHGFKVAAISPELHMGEGHEDAERPDQLRNRWRAMAQAEIDAICTDYPTRLIDSF